MKKFVKYQALSKTGSALPPVQICDQGALQGQIPTPLKVQQFKKHLNPSKVPVETKGSRYFEPHFG